MNQQSYTKPYYFFFLVLPYGISIGFATVVLPYLLTQKGFTVAQAASIVAIGVSSNIWRFLWAPIADITLSLRKWYWIGVSACTATLLILCLIPYNTKQILLLTAIVFLSQVAATFVVLPLGGLMALRVAPTKKGRAGGWYQAGNLGGVGLGGGAGLWLANNYNLTVVGIVLCLLCIAVALVITQVADVKREKTSTLLLEIGVMGTELLRMIKVPILLFVLLLICMPIGTAGIANLWSAVANDWHASPNTIALVTGALSGVVSALGCVAGGWIADKKGVWWAYLGSGGLFALITLAMALLPYKSEFYIFGVLSYALCYGLINAAFSALALYATGTKLAATKYAMISSLANIPVVYITYIDGLVHDKYGSKYMLVVEAVVALVFVVVAVLVLQSLFAKKLVPKIIE
ncbi:MAG: MFS transporter [Flavobacterium sp.]|nr:MFS transporter [Flavobacterium sp.]